MSGSLEEARQPPHPQATPPLPPPPRRDGDAIKCTRLSVRQRWPLQIQEHLLGRLVEMITCSWRRLLGKWWWTSRCTLALRMYVCVYNYWLLITWLKCVFQCFFCMQLSPRQSLGDGADSLIQSKTWFHTHSDVFSVLKASSPDSDSSHVPYIPFHCAQEALTVVSQPY